MRLSPAFALAILCLVGCAGRVTDSTSSVDLNFSDPSSNASASLAAMVSGSAFQRTTTFPLLCTVTEANPPSGLSTRIVRINMDNPVVGAENALVGGGTTYVEAVETTSVGTSTWRSQGGKLTLVSNDAKGSEFTLTDVEMTSFSGSAKGQYKLNGSLSVRF
ncbi:hypothetical protein BH11ARM1_BH11ARM1_18020 [soil metagenome]